VINIVIWTLSRLGMTDDCITLLDCYDAFPQKLNDPTIREQLARLDSTQVYQNTVYQQCHEISDQFQHILSRVFFQTESPLREFITRCRLIHIVTNA
jgi:hypothetical protein